MRFYKLIVIFIFILILLNFNIIIVNASSLDISMDTTIDIYNKDVNIPIYITNNTNNSNYYNIETNIPSFNTNLSKSSFRLDQKSTTKIILNIEPLKNSLFRKYMSSIDFYSNNETKRINLTIIQHNNRRCLLDINYNLNYDQNINKYILNLKLENKASYNQNFLINSIDDQNLNENLNIRALEIKDFNKTFDTNKDSVELKYICNYENKVLNIDIPKKLEENNTTKSTTTGLFNLKKLDLNFNSIYNSLIFQIILVIILIVLVLSFSTKYIKYIYKK